MTSSPASQSDYNKSAKGRARKEAYRMRNRASIRAADRERAAAAYTGAA